MTEQEEDVVVLKEEGEEEIERSFDDEEEIESKPSTKEQILKKLEVVKSPFVLTPALILLLAAIFFLIHQVTKTETTQKAPPQPLSSSSAIFASKDDKELIEGNLRANTLELLISKASFLYDQGDMEEALNIYNEISLYSQSLSLYNLGVARLKKSEYKEALEAFDEALTQKEYRTPSAINAAVCSLHLRDKSSFDRYLKVAREALADDTDSPLFSYYYTLINYYQDKPFHALAGSVMPTVGLASAKKNKLSAKLHLMFDDPSGAIEKLSSIDDPQNYYQLGLIYARVGDFEMASDYLYRSINEKIEVDKAKSALILINLKQGFFKQSSVLISEIIASGKNPLIFPIKTKLKPRLFDINLAQTHFKEHLLVNDFTILQSIFYFTNYQMIDYEKGIKEVEKATQTLSEDEIDDAIGFLEGSRKFLSVNSQIVLATKLALNHNLLRANEVLAKSEEQYRNSDTLEYNLALTYAKLANFQKAYHHFRRAYFLNHKNIQAGVYAAILSSYAGENEKRLANELTEELLTRKDDESRFLLALLSFHDKNYQSTAVWLESKKDTKKAKYLLLDIFAADFVNQQDRLKDSSESLIRLLPDDLLANMIYVYATSKNRTMKQLAFDTQAFMDESSSLNGSRYDLKPLFFGPSVVRDLYIDLSIITGNLFKTRELFVDRLKITQDDTRLLMQSLGLVGIYLQNHQESYAVFNALIDEQGLQDSNTLLYAGVASIGAGHKANAIALLQLAKQKDPENKEARFGLGLLYQEIGNAKGASIEYSLIGEEQFDTHYFDFDIRLANDPEGR